MTPERRLAPVRRLVVAGLILTLGGCAASTTESPVFSSPTAAATLSAEPSVAAASQSPTATPSETAATSPTASSTAAPVAATAQATSTVTVVTTTGQAVAQIYKTGGGIIGALFAATLLMSISILLTSW